MSLSAQTNEQILTLINNEVKQNSEAYQQLKKATETIGHRATGTENGKKAEEYAANLLRSYGYDIVFQEFTFNKEKLYFSTPKVNTYTLLIYFNESDEDAIYQDNIELVELNVDSSKIVDN